MLEGNDQERGEHSLRRMVLTAADELRGKSPLAAARGS